jgi:thymidylate synthase
MRSVDLFLGLPFDVASYALLQRLICRECGFLSGSLVFQLGDAHVYKNHFDAVATVLAREPLSAPTIALTEGASPFTFHPDEAYLSGYSNHGVVPAPLNV